MESSLLPDLWTNRNFHLMFKTIDQTLSECSDEASVLRLLHWKIHVVIEMGSESEIHATANQIGKFMLYSCSIK